MQVNDVNGIFNQAKDHMNKTVDLLKDTFSKMRTGRASPGLIEHLMVNYYDNDVPLSQVASITASDARTLTVSPWETNLIPVIEKAIRNSDLGLNPATSGNAIRVPMPALTEERRKEIVKLAKHEAENARVALRNIRRDANQHLKNLVKDKVISEDDDRRGQDRIQKLTDEYNVSIEKLVEAKEKDLMEV